MWQKGFCFKWGFWKYLLPIHDNVHSSNDVGDKFYYKRIAHDTWSVPAVVLVKHGGIYARVHPCRLILKRPVEPNLTNTDQAVPTSDTKDSQYGTEKVEWRRDNSNKEKTQDKEDMKNKNGIQVSDFKTVMVPWSRVEACWAYNPEVCRL